MDSKHILNSLILATIFWGVASAGTVAQISPELSSKLQLERQSYMSRNQNEREAAKLEKIFRDVENQDFLSLSGAVKELEKMGEEELLIVLLEDGNPDARKLAADAIGRIGSQKNLTRIIDYLNKRNERMSGLIMGNAEIEGGNRALHRSLISAIERITGLSYPSSSDYSRKNVSDFLSEARKWREPIGVHQQQQRNTPVSAVRDERRFDKYWLSLSIIILGLVFVAGLWQWRRINLN